MTRRTRKRPISSFSLPHGPLMALFDAETSSTVVAEACGTTRNAMRRWPENGINPVVADRICARLGLHPADVWGDDWWRIAREMA
jgi:hypothetical protein